MTLHEPRRTHDHRRTRMEMTGSMVDTSVRVAVQAQRSGDALVALAAEQSAWTFAVCGVRAARALGEYGE